MYLKTILFMLFICFGNLLSSKDKKLESEDAFVPSKEWKEIKEGQKVPSGLHYRINLSTGKKEAKIIDEESDPDLESKRFVLPKDNEDMANLNEIEQKNPENDMPKPFRTLDEIKKELGDIELQPKSDMEVLTELFTSFDNEAKKKERDNEVILGILKDLRHLGHQIDNGQEFFKLDGFRKIIYKELNSTNATIKLESLKLFSALVQNNPKVKVHVLETGGMVTLLRILNLETNANIKKSAITALSCTLRNFPYAQNKFIEIGGLPILADLFETESIKLKLKIAVLLFDLITDRRIDNKNFEQHQFIDIEEGLYNLNWCDKLNNLLHDLMVIDLNDSESIGTCLFVMESMVGKCKDHYNNDLILKLYDQYSSLYKNNEDDTAEYFLYMSELTANLIKGSTRDEL